jgi:hypothetical protein
VDAQTVLPDFTETTHAWPDGHEPHVSAGSGPQSSLQGCVHTPDWQLAPGAHCKPHPPQWCGSFSASMATQIPEQHMPVPPLAS